ncbi:hypothetical protein [Catenulispora sp. GP43]|uniref:hypothetical protein n=1 Tax=Catenulispora sp. GP43 TaxID=3156263 RepID=UPI003515509A
MSSLQAERDLYSPRFAFVQYSYDGGTATSRTAYVPATEPHPRNSKIASRRGIGWNGELLTVMSSSGHVDSWTPRAGGVLPEFRGDPERRPGFGFVRGRGGSRQVAQIAAVASPEYAFWLLFLNERAEQVADIPVDGFDEPRLIGLADAAGLHYRRYLLEVDAPTIPLLRSSEYFPGTPTPIDGSRTMVELGRWFGGRSSSY